MTRERLRPRAAWLPPLALLASIAAVSTAYAQVERVEITGSAVRRIDAETALPVQIMRRDDIERTGATTVFELVQKLPAAQGGVEISESIGGTPAGFAGASLRNQGPERTLVLLNGRRLASYAGQTLTGYANGVDLNAIPISAIERVEILLDGASSLYGSDAIGGVINFILRKDMKDGEVNVYMNKTKDGGGNERRISATKGWGDLDKDGFNFMLSLGRDTREQLKSSQRDFAKTGIIDFTEGGKRYLFFNGSARSIPANVFNDAGALVNPYLAVNGRCPPAHMRLTIAPDDFCAFDYASTLDIYPEFERDNVLLSGNWKFPTGGTLFAEFIHSKVDTTTRIAPAPVEVPVAATNPFFTTYLSPIGAPFGPFTTDTVAIWRLMDGGNRTTGGISTSDHFVVGTKDSLMGWDYQTSFTHSVNKYEEVHRDGWMKGRELNDAIASGLLNPFVGQGQQSAAAMAALQNAKHLGTYKDAEFTLDQVLLRGEREAYKTPGGTAMLGAGVDMRAEKLKYDPSDLARGRGNWIALDVGQDIGFDVARRVVAMYGELNHPVSREMEATGSLRFDNYSDVGNTLNYKAAGKYTPSKMFMVRGSVASGFRAPSPAETATGRQLYGVTGGQYACPSPLPVGIPCSAAPTQRDQFAQGNPDLKPEKSTQWSVGARVEPIAQFSAGIDYWHVMLRDRLGQIDESVVFANPAAFQNLFTTFTDPSTGVSKLAIILKNQNLGKQDTRGFDVDLQARFDSPVGRVGSRFLGTYVMRHQYERIPGEGYFTNLGIFNDSEVTFRWVTRWINTLDYGRWNHSLIANYKSGYRDQEQWVSDYTGGVIGADVYLERTVKSHMTWDWASSVKFGKMFKLTAGIINITDEAPPLSLKTVGGHILGYDNRYYDSRGRTLYAQGQVTF